MSPDSVRSPPMQRRKFLTGLGACAFCAIGGGAVGRWSAADRPVPWYQDGDRTDSQRSRARFQPDAIFRVDTPQPLVALTFDDGPDPRFTPTVLDLLDRSGLQATFFLVGVNATVHQDLVAGHQAGGQGIGNHTSTHPELDILDPEAVAAEIFRGEQQIVDVGLERPTLFRPPKGYTDQAVGVLASAERYRTVFWTDCVEDHLMKTNSVAEGVDALLANVGPGSIILAHDGGHVEAPGMPVLDRSPTMDALPRLLDGLDRKGLLPVDLDTLLASADPADR